MGENNGDVQYISPMLIFSFEVFLESVYAIIVRVLFWQKAALRNHNIAPMKKKEKEKKKKNLCQKSHQRNFVPFSKRTLCCRYGSDVLRWGKGVTKLNMSRPWWSNWKMCDLFWIKRAKELLVDVSKREWKRVCVCVCVWISVPNRRSLNFLNPITNTEKGFSWARASKAN